MVKLSPAKSRVSEIKTASMEKQAIIGFLRRLFSRAPALKPALQHAPENVPIKEIRQSLAKVLDHQKALQHSAQELAEQHGLYSNLPKQVAENIKERTKYYLYDPLHPFHGKFIGKKEIEMLAQHDPEYLSKHLHVYIPRARTFKPEELIGEEGRVLFKPKGLLGHDVHIAGERYTKPIAIIEGYQPVEATHRNINQLIEFAKQNNKRIHIVEGAEQPLEVGTIKGLFLGWRPIESAIARLRAGGITGMFTGPWKWTPEEKLYLTKLKYDPSSITASEHLWQGAANILLGKGLPVYLAAASVPALLSPSSSPQKRWGEAKNIAFQAMAPAMYPLPLWAWSPIMKVMGLDHTPGEEQQTVEQPTQDVEAPVPMSPYYG